MHTSVDLGPHILSATDVVHVIVSLPGSAIVLCLSRPQLNYLIIRCILLKNRAVILGPPMLTVTVVVHVNDSLKEKLLTPFVLCFRFASFCISWPEWFDELCTGAICSFSFFGISRCHVRFPILGSFLFVYRDLFFYGNAGIIFKSRDPCVTVGSTSKNFQLISSDDLKTCFRQNWNK